MRGPLAEVAVEQGMELAMAEEAGWAGQAGGIR